MTLAQDGEVRVNIIILSLLFPQLLKLDTGLCNILRDKVLYLYLINSLPVAENILYNPILGESGKIHLIIPDIFARNFLLNLLKDILFQWFCKQNM